MIVVKLGGSVIKKWAEIVEALLEAGGEVGKKILIVPGGGEIADRIRAMNVDDERAHWMAISAMEINSHILLSLSSKLEEISAKNFEEIDFEGAGVLLPYCFMRSNDELPHSWDVTSDSIALWVAGKLGAEVVIKVTDVDGILRDGMLVEKIDADELTFESCLDLYSPYLMKKYGIDVFVCNGLYPQRVKDYILREKAIGTFVTCAEKKRKTGGR
jgi:hypothetical protein